MSTRERPFVVWRKFDAPRGLVWRVWTKCEAVDESLRNGNRGWIRPLDRLAVVLPAQCPTSLEIAANIIDLHQHSQRNA